MMPEVDSFPYEMDTEFSDKKKTRISPKVLQNLTVATISEDSGYKLYYVGFDATWKKGVATDGPRLQARFPSIREGRLAASPSRNTVSSWTINRIRSLLYTFQLYVFPRDRGANQDLISETCP
jgi:hypothetical protein